jgi:hypothetical protein
MSRAAAIKALEARLLEKPAPEKIPERLPLTAIRKNPDVFQLREPVEHEKQGHIETLAKIPADGRYLEAIDVWWDGERWCCIDGHHRLDAYRRAKCVDVHSELTHLTG